ncbi:DMT family transporter [Parabacteroides pacaensis]|uniref:DMT family transporter n=1 Tax=Parabacteroides pacaensis TaxID=2086575 RepID=UPI000D10539F|nr:DMT family transporter [Parabacteroides pacaensis]
MKIAGLKGHMAMLGANIMWGFMSPVSKMVLVGSVVTPLILTDMRIIGATFLFWFASLFTKHEHVSHTDMMKLFFASLLGIVFNQGSFLFGVSLTSPIDASIVTTSTPILTMVIAAIYLKEPVTGKKVMGIFLGASGALLLILSGQQVSNGNGSNIWGDLLCLLAQLSFSLYIVLYKGLISRYSPVTLMKWMFTYSSICIIPFSYSHILATDWENLNYPVLGGIAFVVLGGTFISYLLVPIGQRILRPTVASMYNYIQPIIASIVTIWWGMDTFNILKIVAVILVFTGVFLVTRSRSRAQMEADKKMQQ